LDPCAGSADEHVHLTGVLYGIAKLFAVAVVVMGLSHTIARERLFEGLRARLGGKETWFGYLVSCPYCVSHWVAFVLVPLTGVYAIDVVPSLGRAGGLLRWFLSSILVATVAAFLRVLFYFVDETQGLARRRQVAVEKQVDVEVAQEQPVRDAIVRAGQEPAH
jgi:hypothetical protein